MGYLSAGMVFTCSAANTLVYTDRGTMQAAGAGHIILSIVQVSIVDFSCSMSRKGGKIY